MQKEPLLHTIILGICSFLLVVFLTFFAVRFNKIEENQDLQTELLQKFLINQKIDEYRMSTVEDSLFGHNFSDLLIYQDLQVNTSFNSVRSSIPDGTAAVIELPTMCLALTQRAKENEEKEDSVD